MSKMAGINISVLVGTTQATGTLTFAAGVSDAETVTIGTDVYEFDTAAAPGAVTAGRIRVDVSGGAGAAAAETALVAAINGNDNSVVTAVGSGVADAVICTAKEYGTGGNAVVTTTTCADGSWGAGTLASGANSTIAYQRGGTITINGETVDTTTKDSSIWRTILPTWNDAEVQCNGLADINGATHEILFDACDEQNPVTIRFVLGSGGGRYYSGQFFVTNLQPVSGADHEGVGEMSATFKLNGTLSYQDA
jgi:predicted secreted protein